MRLDRATVFQFTGYLLSGIAAAASTVAIYAVFLWLGVWYVAASVLSDAVGFVMVFLLNKYAVFGKKERVIPHALRYTLVQIGNTVVQAFIVYLLVEYLGADKVLARVVSIGCCVPVNFLLYKHFVYV